LAGEEKLSVIASSLSSITSLQFSPTSLHIEAWAVSQLCLSPFTASRRSRGPIVPREPRSIHRWLCSPVLVW